MPYQVTPFSVDENIGFITSGIDGSLWSLQAGILYWFDGARWQQFTTGGETITCIAVHKLGAMWAIGQSQNVYYFNGIAWSPQPPPPPAAAPPPPPPPPPKIPSQPARQMPPRDSARSLSVGPDGVVWLLDDNTPPQVWQLDATGEKWSPFGTRPSDEPAFASISSGGPGNGAVILAALDGAGGVWTCNSTAALWAQIQTDQAMTFKSVSAGEDGSIFAVDAGSGCLWRWKAGSASWESLAAQPTGVAQVAVQKGGRLLASDGSKTLYTAVETFPSVSGFRGSDWNNDGTAIYAVRWENYDVIHRSTDGVNFDPAGCASLPNSSSESPPFVTDPYFQFSIHLMIPTAKKGATEKLLVSPICSQRIYLFDDLSNINPETKPQEVFTDPDFDPKCPETAGVLNGFADDAEGNVYAGWYSNGSPHNKAILYYSPASGGYQKGTWSAIMHWDARHIHAVSVNPCNNYLYVVLGEPRMSSYVASESGDSAKVMRSKDGGKTWSCLTDTWVHTPVMPFNTVDKPAPYLGLYFSTIGFIDNRVVLGEDTDYRPGRIFYFDDDGRDGTDPAHPLPFTPQATYQTANNGEFFLGAASLNGRLYMASQYLAPTLENFPGPIASTRCVSTSDGITWRVEQICARPPDTADMASSTLGIMTLHPDRRGRLVYSLSQSDSFTVMAPTDPARATHDGKLPPQGP